MSVSYGPNLGLLINALTGDAYPTDFRKFLRALDALLEGAVIDRAHAAPPVSPANGDRYLVAAAPTGAFAGFANAIAVWTTDNPATPGGLWEFYVPKVGWDVWSIADAAIYVFGGSTWAQAGAAAIAVETARALAAEALSEKTANKGAASGYCPLDSGSLVPVANLPALVVGHVYVVASQAAMLALSPNLGDVAVRTDINESFILQSLPASTLGNWVEILTPPGVTSIAIGVDSGGILTKSGSPVTTSGTLQLQFATQALGKFLAGPISGGPATPAFRAIDPADVPAIAAETTRAEAAEALLAPKASPTISSPTITGIANVYELFTNTHVVINSSTPTPLTATGLTTNGFYLLRDNTNGGSCLAYMGDDGVHIFYTAGTTIFVTGAPTATQIQISYVGAGTYAMCALAGSSRNGDGITVLAFLL